MKTGTHSPTTLCRRIERTLFGEPRDEGQTDPKSIPRPFPLLALQRPSPLTHLLSRLRDKFATDVFASRAAVIGDDDDDARHACAPSDTRRTRTRIFSLLSRPGRLDDDQPRTATTTAEQTGWVI